MGFCLCTVESVLPSVAPMPALRVHKDSRALSQQTCSSKLRSRGGSSPRDLALATCQICLDNTVSTAHLCVCIDQQDEAVHVHGEVTSSNKLTVTLLPHLQTGSRACVTHLSRTQAVSCLRQADHAEPCGQPGSCLPDVSVCPRQDAPQANQQCCPYPDHTLDVWNKPCGCSMADVCQYNNSIRPSKVLPGFWAQKPRYPAAP